LNEFFNPAPKVYIPEEEDVDSARLIELNEYNDNNFIDTSNQLLLKSDISLNTGIYTGKKVSRKELTEDNSNEEMSVDSSDASDKELHDSDDTSGSTGEDENNNDGDMSFFKVQPNTIEKVDELEKQLEELDAQNDDITVINRNPKEELEKAEHTKKQKELWESTLNLRIRLQKCINIANKLPQPDSYNLFSTFNKNLRNSYEMVISNVKDLLNDLIEIQEELYIQNPMTDITDSEPPLKKSKPSLTPEDFWTRIATTEIELNTSRISVIDKWNSKTNLVASAFANKNFKALNQSIVSQVNKVLEDKEKKYSKSTIKEINL